MQKRWLVKTPVESTTLEEFRSTLKVDRIVAELLMQRGITSFEDAETFFRPKLDQLHNPFLMKDLKKAVERVNLAIAKGEKILLFGDYDVDGTTAVALLYGFLIEKHQNLDYYIPDRYSEGYGISMQGIDFAAENDFKLIISLDCGIRSVEHVKYAQEKGIDFIICDHHNPGDTVPDCIVLDPKQKDCDYPYKELSGCGVGFKLLHGLCLENDWKQSELFNQLDLLAVSIGADIVPVTGENRVLCYHGMMLLNAKPRPAFVELLRIAKREFPVTLTDVVFTIAPRINAAGRLRSGKHAVELMISDNVADIRRLAAAIDEDNKERRQLDQVITSEALELIEQNADYENRKTTVVFKNDWHKGVVGIVASRLIEKHYRPTIVLTESNGKATGSARTVNDFDIHAALVKCEHLLEQFGGHTHAAGMTMALENVTAFQEHFEKVVQESITIEDETPEQEVDIEIDFNEIFTNGENRMKIPRIKRILEQFEPHGPGNMKPVFLAKNVYSTDVRLLKDVHLKLSMTQPNSDVVIEGIGFNLGDKIDDVAAGVPFDLVFTMESNKWNNRETLQLNIKDIRSVL
ncbi:MAG: single-stranded-DNA-specific exonuclease RecJ [Crocinitomicaceae bacterium]|jgi:single-stranded-DNA-specific exonuclease|nr:single-stranded-DNA-specific exonuclease RecJ [Crocinitomicaceae bacterium]MDP5010631.1 single-stranded-DNA-specific exonuclease RecJ [Crocinitomicaceae bacterium]